MMEQLVVFPVGTSEDVESFQVGKIHHYMHFHRIRIQSTNLKRSHEFCRIEIEPRGIGRTWLT